MTETDQDSSFFSKADEKIARHFVETQFGPGNFDDGTLAAEKTDHLLNASLASTRDYMRQSEGCRSDNGSPFRVFPVLVNSLETNAFAARTQDLHICGLKSGLYGAAFELALTAMSHSRVFSEIGNPSLEVDDLDEIGSPPSFWMIDQILEFGDLRDRSYANAIVPKCPKRMMFAMHLTLLFLRFVWFHELYHCLNGHIGSLGREGASLCLHENPGDTSMASLVQIDTQPLPLDLTSYLQILELDADRSALWGALQTQLQDKENIIGLAEFPKPTRCSAAYFVAFLACYLFDQIALREVSANPSSHPAAYARLHNLLRTTATHLNDGDGVSKRGFEAAVRELDRLRDRIPALVAVNRVLEDAAASPTQTMLDDMDEKLERVRPFFGRWGYK